MEWDLTNDKARISEVMSLADASGPQTIVNGERRYTVTPQVDETVVADEDDRPLTPPNTFKEWILNGPRIDDLDIERDRSPMRDVDL